jgi:hypothetical protein
MNVMNCERTLCSECINKINNCPTCSVTEKKLPNTTNPVKITVPVRYTCYHDNKLPSTFEVDEEVLKLSKVFSAMLQDSKSKEMVLTGNETREYNWHDEIATCKADKINVDTMNAVIEFMKLQLAVGKENPAMLELPKIVIGRIENNKRVPQELVSFISELYDFKGCTCPKKMRTATLRHLFFDFYSCVKYIDNQYAYDLCNHFLADRIKRLRNNENMDIYRNDMATELYGYKVTDLNFSCHK